MARSSLRREAAFFASARASAPLGPTLTQGEVDGCKRILAACGAAGWGLAWTAYALATAYHETAGQLAPIREYRRGKGRAYGAPGKHDGQIAYGRGYVQLTWDYNYEKLDKLLSLNGALVNDYDLALDPATSAQIMVKGMETGIFTGRELADTLPRSGRATRQQFYRSRPIINGMDRAGMITDYAVALQAALETGDWEVFDV